MISLDGCNCTPAQPDWLIGESSVLDTAAQLTLFQQERLFEMAAQQIVAPYAALRGDETQEYVQAIVSMARVAILFVHPHKGKKGNQGVHIKASGRATILPFGFAVLRTVEMLRAKDFYRIRYLSDKEVFHWIPDSKSHTPLS